MKRVLGCSAMLAVTVIFGSVLPSGAADDVPAIKDIMKKCTAGPKSLCALIGMALKEKEPKWEEVQKEAKELAECAAFLPKNKPPMGDAASWDKLSKEFAETAKALQTAADKKDLDESKADQAKLAKSCGACHSMHKPKK